MPGGKSKAEGAMTTEIEARKSRTTNGLLSQSDILARPGWTRVAVRRFLGDPAATKPNPMYRSAAPMRFWRQERVEAVEAREDWIAWAEQSGRRSERAKEAAARQRNEVLEWVDGLEIQIRAFDSPAALTAAAVAHYNDLWLGRAWERGDQSLTDKHATSDDSPEFLDRITVNFLRHECSEYERLLVRLFGSAGASEARSRLKSRILNEIAEVYPWLSGEADRQWMAVESAFGA